MRLRRFVKYASVSAVSTATSLSLLGILVGALGYSPTLSNVIATAVGTVPSFELNRRWVWGRRGPGALMRQAVPYCALSLAGLVVSTIAVRLAGAATLGSGRLVHTAAVEVANFGSYGILWLFQFVLCDRLLFRTAPPDRAAGHPCPSSPSRRSGPAWPRIGRDRGHPAGPAAPSPSTSPARPERSRDASRRSRNAA